MNEVSKFEEVVKQDTPRLVVMFKYENGTELFQWGVVGQIPSLTTIGAIVRVQSEIYFKAAKECPAPALVITYDPTTKAVDWFIHPSIPIDPMVGMLEKIKSIVLDAQRPKGPSILGPDGLAVRNGVSL